MLFFLYLDGKGVHQFTGQFLAVAVIWLLQVIRVTHQTASLEIKTSRPVFQTCLVWAFNLTESYSLCKVQQFNFPAFPRLTLGGGSLFFYCLPCLTVEAQTSSCIAPRFTPVSSGLSIYWAYPFPAYMDTFSPGDLGPATDEVTREKLCMMLLRKSRLEDTQPEHIHRYAVLTAQNWDQK